MTSLEIKDRKGKAAGALKVSDSVFAIEPNINVMHQVVCAQRSWWRQGTHSTKTRAAVRGGGRKPFRQKGTGRARQGTIRSPQQTGGGVVFGPHPRSYGFKVNKKVIKLAMRSALSGKVAAGELYVLEDLNFDKASTKEAKKLLSALEISGRTTLVIDDDDINTYLSFRNLKKVRVIGARQSNTYDLLDNTALLMTKTAVKYVEGVLV